MKVFVLAVLLVCACSLEGALVKREAEPAQAQDFEILQKIREALSNMHTFMTTELAQQEKLEEIKAQAQAYLQTVRERVDPMTTQLQKAATSLAASFLEIIRSYTPNAAQSS